MIVELVDFNSYNFKESKYKIKVKVYCFKYLKLFEIIFSESGFKIFKKEKKYNYTFIEFIKILLGDENRKLLKLFSLDNYKALKIKIKEFDLDLKIGVFENMVTGFVVTILSTIVSIFLGNHIKKYNRKKYYFKITPVYDELYFDMKLNLKFEIKTFSIYKFILGNKDRLKELFDLLKELNFKSINENNSSDTQSISKKLKESSI